MSLIFRKERKPVKWVLKAKPPDSSDWEIVEEYSERKTYADLKDVIDQLREEGYEAVRLDAYDKDNRFVKHEFVRSFAAAKQLSSFKSFQKLMIDVMSNQMTVFNELLKTQTELIKQLNEAKRSISENKPDYMDAIAQVLYLKELERQLSQVLGVQPQDLGASQEFQKFVLEIVTDLVKKYMPEIQKKFEERFAIREKPKAPTVAPALPLTPPANVELPKPPPEAYEAINKIVSEVEESLKPPCMKGEEKCLET